MLNRSSSGNGLIHKQKIGFLGPTGTYSYIATKSIFESSTPSAPFQHIHPEHIEYVALPSISDVFEKVESAELNLGVVPVENSIEGVVRDSVSSLISRSVCVLKEVELPIEHCLLSKESHIDDVKIIRAHPQALAQCKVWLETHVPSAMLIPESSNSAGAVGLAAHEAVIGSRELSVLYGLNCIAEHISDTDKNTTLFYVITKNTNDAYKKETVADDVDKVVIAQKQAVSLFFIEAEDKPGVLKNILGLFADAGLNVRKIHSLPTGEIGSYYFLLDVVTTGYGQQIQDIYSRLESMCKVVKVLGVL
jgi:prephenate dehydratase